MRKIVIFLVMVLCCFSCNQNKNRQEITYQDVQTSDSLPFIKFEQEKQDFGKIKDNEKITVTFEFTNNGKQPLIVQKAEPTCGCTVADWTKTPVEYQQKGFVKATFNPKGIEGTFSKSIFVKTNAQNDVVLLKLVGKVVD